MRADRATRRRGLQGCGNGAGPPELHKLGARKQLRAHTSHIPVGPRRLELRLQVAGAAPPPPHRLRRTASSPQRPPRPLDGVCLALIPVNLNPRPTNEMYDTELTDARSRCSFTSTDAEVTGRFGSLGSAQTRSLGVEIRCCFGLSDAMGLLEMPVCAMRSS